MADWARAVFTNGAAGARGPAEAGARNGRRETDVMASLLGACAPLSVLCDRAAFAVITMPPAGVTAARLAPRGPDRISPVNIAGVAPMRPPLRVGLIGCGW